MLGAANLGADGIGLRVNNSTDLPLFQVGGHLVRVIEEAFADRQDADLLGGEPGGEGAGIVLGEDAEEAFEGAEQGWCRAPSAPT